MCANMGGRSNRVGEMLLLTGQDEKDVLSLDPSTGKVGDSLMNIRRQETSVCLLRSLKTI
jgi:hypothetical protein